MADYSILVLFIQMFCLPKLAEGIRNDILYPKTNVMRTKAMSVVEFVALLIFCFMMANTYLNLDLSNDRVVYACYVYIVVNIIVQVVLQKREKRKSKNPRCVYSRMIWMTGMTLHSLFLLVALLEFQNNHIWKTVVGGFYIIYGLGYFFFIYFTEKEVLNPTCERKKK